MTRTEQFLRGYDDCRGSLQCLLSKNPELQKNDELMKLAGFPYYNEEGIDWHIDCTYCKNRDLDMDWNLYCRKEMKVENIKEKCEFHEVDEE